MQDRPTTPEFWIIPEPQHQPSFKRESEPATLKTLKEAFVALLEKNKTALELEEKKIRALLANQNSVLAPTHSPSETVLRQLGDQYSSADKVEKNKILNEAAFTVVPGSFKIRNFFSNLRNRFFPSEEFKKRREQFRKIFEKETAKAEIIEGLLKGNESFVNKGLNRKCFDDPKGEFSKNVYSRLHAICELKLTQKQEIDQAKGEILKVELGLSASRKRQQKELDEDALRWHLGQTHQKAHKNRV